jgi:hypothetical protein
MNREDVESVELGKPGKEVSVTTGKPTSYSVAGLADHLQAKIVIAFGGVYKYELVRTGDRLPYVQEQGSPTPEAALEALKNLLNWDPA